METSYIADQKISFAQLVWDKKIGKHDFLAGTAIRYNFYDDNTPATSTVTDTNQPEKIGVPGIFAQDEIGWTKSKLLLGARVDFHKNHGTIFTPRIAYKYAPSDDNIIRLNAGTGFRVVNLFTEDHAALTGGRNVIIEEQLNPEKSYNVNLNYIKKFFFHGGLLELETTGFYTYFTNKIAPDYETDSNQIIYKNLDGFAVSKGFGLNSDLTLTTGWKMMLGATLMENTLTENNKKTRQLLTEKFSATWGMTYQIPKWKLTVDYTGNLYSPMLLPLASDLDPRSPKSPWWSIQNIQFTYIGFKNWEIYGGIKNLLNWTPAKNNPFLIAGSEDPFDKNVQLGSNGQVLPTADNPYAMKFDPSYVYAPNQGIRAFFGIRFKLT